MPLGPRTRVLAFAALLALLPGCETGEKVLGHVDGPVKAEVIKEAHWAAGEFPSYATNCMVRVHATPDFDEQVGCAGKLELAEDEGGKLIAYRSAGAPWEVIRLGGGSRHFVDCKPPLGSGSKPDFARIDALASAWPRILSCNHDTSAWPYQHLLSELGEELEATSGPEARAAMFVKLFADQPDPLETDDGNSDDPWVGAFNLGVPEPARAAVLEKICGATRDPASTSRSYLRALRVCPLDAPGLAEAAATRAAHLLERPAAVMNRSMTGAERLDDLALHWSMTLAARKNAGDLGVRACAFATTAAEDDDRRGLALATIAATKTKCPALGARVLQMPPCEWDVRCEDHVCKPGELKHLLDEWLAEPDARGDYHARQRFGPPRDAMILAALYVQGPLPKWLTTQLARHDYKLLGPAKPMCVDKLALGTPCNADLDTHRAELCRLPLDGGALDLRGLYSTVRANDRKRVIEPPRKLCFADAGTACTSLLDCCLGLTCRGDGTGDACQPSWPDGG